MTSYRYTFLSLRDEQIIEEIDLYGVFAQRILCAPGQFNGTFQLDQTGKRNQDLIAATTPGKTWLVMEREDVPVWWGIVWSRTYQSQSKSAQLYAWGFEAFPQRQIMLTDFVRENVDQIQVFLDMWTDMQSSAPGRNMNVNIPTTFPLSQTISTNVLATDYKYYGDVMDSIANASNGFDWTVQVTKYNNMYRKDLLVGYPILGAETSADSLVFEYPGPILNYYEAESMSEAGNYTWGFGAGEGAAQLVSIVKYDDMINEQGWPRWDMEVSLKDVDNQSILDGLTMQEGIKRKPPMNTYTVTVKGDVDPVFGSYTIGDNCTLYIKDPKHPDGFSVKTRIVGFELTPQSAENSEEVSLILPGDDVDGKTPVAAE